MSISRLRVVRGSLPPPLAPRVDAYEFVDNGRFRFHIEIRQPLAGLIVRYRGWLAPSPSA